MAWMPQRGSALVKELFAIRRSPLLVEIVDLHARSTSCYARHTKSFFVIWFLVRDSAPVVGRVILPRISSDVFTLATAGILPCGPGTSLLHRSFFTI